MSLSRLSTIANNAVLAKTIPLSVFMNSNASLVGSGTYKVYKFLNSGFITLNGTGTIYYVIIGGGSSGGGSGTTSGNKVAAGGGGAGGVTSGYITQLTSTTYNITIGAGVSAVGVNATGKNGLSSQINYNSINIIANGGGTNNGRYGGNTGGTSLELNGVFGVTETGSSGYGAGGSSTGGTSGGGSVLNPNGCYTLNITSPSYTGLFASGGGGGNCENTTTHNSYGAGQGGTGSVFVAQSGIANTGSAGGGERSYGYNSTHNSQSANAGTGGS